MSAEAIVFTSLAAAGVPVLAGAAAVAAAGIVYFAIKYAREKKESEKKYMARWRQFQEDQRAKYEAIEQLQKELAATVESLEQTTLTEAVMERQAESEASGEGFLDVGRREIRAEMDTLPHFEAIEVLIESLPQAFKDDPDWPYHRMAADRNRLRSRYDAGQNPSADELAAFRKSIGLTLSRFIEAAADRARAEKDLGTRADAVLDDVLTYTYLALRERHRAELNSIRDNLTTQAEEHRLNWGDLELYEKRMTELKDAVDRDQQFDAYRRTLADSSTRFLEEMGYAVREPFNQAEADDWSSAQLTAPGGARLKAVIDDRGRMIFKLDPARSGFLTPSEAIDYRRQETKWCEDLKLLLAKLAEEGFSLNTEMERTLPEDALQIADLVTAEELAEEEELERQELIERERER